MKEKVRVYIAATEQLQRSGATKADAERVLAMVTEDFRIEHPAYKERCSGGSRERFRQGLMHYLGQYDRTEIEIHEMMMGLDTVAVRATLNVGYPRDGEMVQDSDQGLMVFEFRGDKIAVLHKFL